ncbi:homoprotocatechuate degradation operon regulator HpaR [Noviherbaspirillum sp. UKPF54]|uniref:homoprotocatechuate degradation operon regulator HpaR n=1 Tax=Noviherbaspirillum sp. UKPF54 TaxID=2601898 RepID=UPI0011B13249|nr:homoprotocatechuate degradation operon regulator HpaR [Noviherbaspirillum sp. UKPF54]QDZ26653.1 homoprotocatechuate degradation operon regulator HpaR [Noviherbaspirillum sp. UKPF54]
MEHDVKHRINYRNLPQLFLKARESLMSHFRPILNHFGVTEQQWRILRVLDEYGQLEPRELCEMCQFLSSSMAGVLARMEEIGLIQRNRVVEDQRRVLVRLAPEGDALISKIAPLIDLQYEYIEQAFGKRAIDELFKALEGFIAAQGDSVEHVNLPAADASDHSSDDFPAPEESGLAARAAMRRKAGK